MGILLFDDVEVLDFAGPFEVFSITRLAGGEAAYEVCLISVDGDPVNTRGDMTVEAHYSLGDCPPLNILVVPGGLGTRREVNNGALRDWLTARHAELQYLTSVCTGSFLLAAAGLLDGKRATTHWQSLDRMRDAYPGVDVEYACHVVRDDNVFTSAGISAGIDMALAVVAAQLGEEVARTTAKHMEYRYPESNQRRVTVNDQ